MNTFTIEITPEALREIADNLESEGLEYHWEYYTNGVIIQIVNLWE